MPWRFTNSPTVGTSHCLSGTQIRLVVLPPGEWDSEVTHKQIDNAFPCARWGLSPPVNLVWHLSKYKHLGVNGEPRGHLWVTPRLIGFTLMSQTERYCTEHVTNTPTGLRSHSLNDTRTRLLVPPPGYWVLEVPYCSLAKLSLYYLVICNEGV